MKRMAGFGLVAAVVLAASGALARPAGPDDDEGPVIAGPLTAEAARGAELFAAERWMDAAIVEGRVARGETGDAAGNRQIARYRLAVALHRLGLQHASFGFFSAIADDPSDLRYGDALLWLARLAAELPEPADVAERIGHYPLARVARLDAAPPRGDRPSLIHLLGRYRYRNRDYEGAIRLFATIDREDRRWVEAQIFTGVAFVQLRKPVLAIQTLERLAPVLEDHAADPALARLRDLLHLSVARAYYSSAFAAGGGGTAIDASRLAAALRSWNRVDPEGPSWPDALFERSWGHFMSGDYPQALGSLHALRAPYFEGFVYPEADVLEALIAFATCRYDDTITLVARMLKRYWPIRRELGQILSRIEEEGGPERALRFLDEIRGGGGAGLSTAVRSVVVRALSDREIGGHSTYVRAIDEEIAHLGRMPVALRASALGGEVADALDLARGLAVENAGALVRARLERAAGELDRHLAEARALLADVGEARGAARASRIVAHGPTGPDHEHEVWPFDGEFWRDELGSYRQVVISRCGR